MPFHLEFVEEFAQPAFSELVTCAFSELQESSDLLAAARAEDAANAKRGVAALSHPEMLRCGAFIEGKLVGWSFGWFEREGMFYMANSGVVAEHRRKGIYSALVHAVIDRTREVGASGLRSRHLCINNAVLIAKLKLGFHISGMEYSEEFGPLVRLSYFHGESRRSLLRQRAKVLAAPRPRPAEDAPA